MHAEASRRMYRSLAMHRQFQSHQDYDTTLTLKTSCRITPNSSPNLIIRQGRETVWFGAPVQNQMPAPQRNHASFARISPIIRSANQINTSDTRTKNTHATIVLISLRSVHLLLYSSALDAAVNLSPSNLLFNASVSKSVSNKSA